MMMAFIHGFAFLHFPFAVQSHPVPTCNVIALPPTPAGHECEEKLHVGLAEGGVDRHQLGERQQR